VGSIAVGNSLNSVMIQDASKISSIIGENNIEENELRSKYNKQRK